MAPQDARERCARQRLVIEPAEYHKALKVYAQVHDLVSEAIDEGGVAAGFAVLDSVLPTY